MNAIEVVIFGIKLTLKPIAFTIPIGNGWDVYWYGIIIAIGFLLLIVTIYFVLYKRVQKGKSAIDKIKDTQKSIQEESLKLDGKLVELLNQQLNVQTNISNNDSANQKDHSLALKVADEIVRIEMNLSRMDTSIKGHKQLSGHPCPLHHFRLYLVIQIKPGRVACPLLLRFSMLYAFHSIQFRN